MKLFLLLIVICFNSFGQRTFVLDKSQTDSIKLSDYKIFLASENIDIDFIGREIPKQKRFNLTHQEAIAADQLFKDQYVKAAHDQYYKQFYNPDRYADSTDYEQGKLIYKKSYRRIDSNAKRDLKKKIKKYDRYFFGYINQNAEKLVLMRFDPHQIKYFSIPGTGESHIDVLTIYVLNLDKKDLSMSGFADFKEY